MSLHAVPSACMQFLSSSEQLTRISQCLFFIGGTFIQLGSLLGQGLRLGLGPGLDNKPLFASLSATARVRCFEFSTFIILRADFKLKLTLSHRRSIVFLFLRRPPRSTTTRTAWSPRTPETPGAPGSPQSRSSSSWTGSARTATSSTETWTSIQCAG